MKLRLAVALLMLIAVIRVALTWTTFSQTADEPAHVASGMEVLARHRYTIHLENTPLPRIVLTLIPWLSGTEYRPDGSVTEQGNSVIYSRAEYLANLVRIRAGNLVFFFVAMLFTWLWARDAIGNAGGLTALFFFTTQPVILGHAGLATTDMAAVAGIAAALYAWSKWLDMPSIARAVAAGAAYGFAINCKLSAVVFVPAAWLAILAVRFVQGRPSLRPLSMQLPVVIAASVVAMWAGYGFDVGSMNSVEPVSDAFVPQWLASAPILAPRLFRGIVKLMATDVRGHPQYLFGMSSMLGWWWYFPAALALKSALATLIAAAIGLVKRFRVIAEPAAVALAILLVSMTTHINVGIRYILVIFVPLSILAAAGVLELWPRRRVLAVVLLAWQTLTGLTHPDYFVYFNELAGREPSRYLLDSDLDWGQDLLRLEDELRRRNVQRFGFKFFGPADLSKHKLPPWTEIRIDQPMKGWVAISENFYNGIWYDGYHPRRYPWLVSQKPVARVGKSIRLYFIP